MKLRNKQKAGWRLLSHGLLAILHYVCASFLVDIKKVHGSSRVIENTLRDANKLRLKQESYMIICHSLLNIKMRTYRLNIQAIRILEENLKDFVRWIFKPFFDWLILLKLRRHIRNQRFLVYKLEALRLQLLDERDALLAERSQLIDKSFYLEAEYGTLLLCESNFGFFHFPREEVACNISNIVEHNGQISLAIV